MKSTHLIDEFKELIGDYLRHYYPYGTQYLPRNAICFTTYNTVPPKHEMALSRQQVLEMLQSLFDGPIPILPNLDSTADEADQIRAVLGQEFPALILDCTVSWPDNTLGAAAGCIKAPGILFLLLPEGLELTNAASPYEIYLKNCFKKHMTPVREFPSVWSVAPLDVSLVSNKKSFNDNNQHAHWQDEQKTVVDELANRCRANHKTLDLLLAKRGRGKSATLGQLLGAVVTERHRAPKKQPNKNQLPIDEDNSDITLTASHRDQVITAVRHADTCLIQYTPLDAALNNKGEILVVDEAGSVPLPVLKQLAENYTHTILAGTVDGYEGSGRALAVRLSKTLSQSSPSSTSSIPVQTHTLRHPIRWSEGDPVEAMIQDVLRLGLVEPKTPKLNNTTFSLSDIRHQMVTSDQLLNDAALLDDIFGLLLQAHYQTTSKDLKHLLNQQQLTLWTQTHNGKLTGACLIAHEGDLSETLQDGIQQGVRRPAHQTLPMLLHRQSSHRCALSKHYWRVVRIAIAPSLQRHGLGKHFLQSLHDEAIRLKAKGDTAPTYIGASFGASEEGFHFWQNSGFIPIHLGFRLNPRSAQRSLAVLKPIHQEKALMHAHQQFIDSAIILQKLLELKPLWLDRLYTTHSFDKALLANIITTSASLQTLDMTTRQAIDSQRLTLWKNNQLSLHDIWGPLARTLGGVESLAALNIPPNTTAKQLTKLLQSRI